MQKGKDLNINVDAGREPRLADMQVQSEITDTDKFHDLIRSSTGMTFEEYREQQEGQ